MLLKAPFRLPDGWLKQFGYPGGRRFVALYWEPCGDEACYDDGVSSACGMSDNYLYLGFVHKPAVAEWLIQNDIRLGDSEREAQHWLVAESSNGDLYAVSRRDAYSLLLAQELPGKA